MPQGATLELHQKGTWRRFHKLMSDETQFLLARTFYWLAGIGATVTGALCLSHLDLSSRVSTMEALLEKLATQEHPVTEEEWMHDHDKLVEIGVTVGHIEDQLRELLAEIRSGRSDGT